MNDLYKPSGTLQLIREQSPLVHNLSNYVAMDFMANSLLAVGASPAMVHAQEEVAEFAAIASAINVNIGTLSPSWLEAMVTAMRVASENNKFSVLDPVGVFATAYRQRACRELLKFKPTVLCGNASEIICLAGLTASGGKGVDSTQSSDSAVDAALSLSDSEVVVISGKIDHVCAQGRHCSVANGHSTLAKITASGCTLNALIAACGAVNNNAFVAAVHACAIQGVAADIAASKTQSPASFRVAFIDALYDMTPAILDEQAKIKIVSE